jgi:hypothetical protein
MLLAPEGNRVASAQSPALVTDRPDQTESAAVVPRGFVQIETGYLFTHDGEVNRYEVPGTVFRIGIGGRTELRLGHAGIVGGAGSRGAGDSEIGGKVTLVAGADGWQPELAILGGLSLPTGRDGFSSDGVDPSFLVSLAHGLSPKASLGYNVGAEWASSPDRPVRDAFIVFTTAIGFELADRWGAFLELFGDRQTTGATATTVSMDGGLTFLLTDVIQFDVYVGRGLRGPTDDRFFGTGLSFRLPR